MHGRTMFKFRLYVTDDMQNAAQALANLTPLSRAHLPESHAIKVVNVFREPRRALRSDIRMTPTLIKLSPTRRIIGNLSQTQSVFQKRGLETGAL